MEWFNILTIVMPVILVMIVGIFYNNRRIDDLRSGMNQRFNDMNQSMNQRFSVIQEDIREIKNFMMEFLKRESGYTLRDK